MLKKERLENPDRFTGQRGASKESVKAKVEELAYTEKAVKALVSCEVHLGKSISALDSSSEEFDNLIWHAAAELEYALFLFSLKGSEDDVTLIGKAESRYRSDSTAERLDTVQTLIAQSKKSIDAGDWLRAHKCAYDGSNILLRIQRERAKKK